MVLTKRVLVVVCITAALRCSSTTLPAAPDGSVNIARHAFTLAETNRTRVNKIRLGQTLVEVERIMGPPERRAARLRYDGVSVEEWSYITDYVRKMDALILFVGGKVQEIQSTPWEEQERDSMEGAEGRDDQ
jgi:hypothetical protein